MAQCGKVKTQTAMSDNTEQWKKDGWNHDPRKLVDIMVKYSESHDSTSVDMEMIDDILTIAAERPKAWNEAIDACMKVAVIWLGKGLTETLPQDLIKDLESLKHKQP